MDQNFNSLQSLQSLFVETVLNYWTALLSVPVGSLSLTLIHPHVESQKFIRRSKNEYCVCII